MYMQLSILYRDTLAYSYFGHSYIRSWLQIQLLGALNYNHDLLLINAKGYTTFLNVTSHSLTVLECLLSLVLHNIMIIIVYHNTYIDTHIWRYQLITILYIGLYHRQGWGYRTAAPPDYLKILHRKWFYLFSMSSFFGKRLISLP